MFLLFWLIDANCNNRVVSCCLLYSYVHPVIAFIHFSIALQWKLKLDCFPKCPLICICIFIYITPVLISTFLQFVVLEYNKIEYRGGTFKKIHTTFYAWVNVFIINNFANIINNGERQLKLQRGVFI